MKYVDLYVSSLYDALERGGAQDVVDRMVMEINAPTQVGLDAWTKETGAMPCSVCGGHYRPASNPKLDEEALCPAHATIAITLP